MSPISEDEWRRVIPLFPLGVDPDGLTDAASSTLGVSPMRHMMWRALPTGQVVH